MLVIDNQVKVTHRLVQLFVFSVVPEPRSLQLLNLNQKLEKYLVVVLFFEAQCILHGVHVCLVASRCSEGQSEELHAFKNHVLS